MANIELDGPNKKIKVDSGDLTLDVPGDIVLDADGGDVVFADGGTNLLKVTNSSSDVVLQPQVDTKDIVFKQYDGTVVATVEDNATFNIPASKLAIGGTAVTATAAELNILDGVTATAAEINLIDGGTARGTTAIADGDGVLINDAGTMRMTNVTTLKTYMGVGANTPAFHAHLSANQSISNATDTKVQFNTELYDTDNSYDNSSNYRFTPQTAGKYFIYTQVYFDTGANNNNIDYAYIETRKNGTAIMDTMFDFRDDRDGRKFALNSHIVQDFNGSSDYIEIFGSMSANETGDLRFGGASSVHKSHFGAYKIII